MIRPQKIYLKIERNLKNSSLLVRMEKHRRDNYMSINHWLVNDEEDRPRYINNKLNLKNLGYTFQDVHVAPLVKILKSTLINISRKVQENDLKLICLRHKV